MKLLSVTSTWRASTTIEIDDDVEVNPSVLDDSWPEDVLEQVTTQGAELVDWDVSVSPLGE
jgi:hypothetical protein